MRLNTRTLYYKLAYNIIHIVKYVASMAKINVKESAGFGSLVRDVSKLVRKCFEQKSANHGLTQAQWMAINHLIYNEGINQKTLAEMMEIEPITLTGLIDRLEHAGWVERRHDASDRRVRLLYLTKQAHPILEQMNEIKMQVREKAFVGISPKEQQKIMKILRNVRDNLAEKPTNGTKK
jgi:MarR family transcriptional regulator for hemolysin